MQKFWSRTFSLGCVRIQESSGVRHSLTSEVASRAGGSPTDWIGSSSRSPFCAAYEDEETVSFLRVGKITEFCESVGTSLGFQASADVWTRCPSTSSRDSGKRSRLSTLGWSERAVASFIAMNTRVLRINSTVTDDFRASSEIA